MIIMQRRIYIHMVTLFVCFLHDVNSQSCEQKRYFGENSFVCVCNSTGCDSFGQVDLPALGFFLHTLSSRDEFRFFQRTEIMASDQENVTSFLFVNDTDIRQEMLGFGGAFTDAAGIAFASLSDQIKDTLLSEYFSPDGLEYNLGRIPMAGSDFSTYPYSYDDVEGDTDLEFFNLTMEDHLYKLPFLRKAVELSGRRMLFFGSPWSPPSWMKTNGMFNGTGGLLPEMRQPWSNYFVKFIEAYQQEGVDLWGLTVQNEPSSGLITDWRWNACGFTAEEERDFVKDYLGPTLNASGWRSLKLMAVDDSREIFPSFPTTVLEDSDAAQYIDGTAVHWYVDAFTPVSVVTAVHNRFPDKFLLYTEASAGETPGVENVRLGHWDRGEDYVLDIIENVNHWVTGWVDWNMALDMQGGPNWSFNYLDSPIIVNKDNDEFYKQPMFYAMGHFSKFISEGYFSLGLEITQSTAGEVRAHKIDAAAFTDPTKTYNVLVIANAKDVEETIQIEDSKGNSFHVVLPLRSFSTIVYDSTSADVVE